MRFKNYYNLLEKVPAMNSIPHIQQMNVTQVLDFIGDNFDIRDYDISEKVDGANFSLTVLNNVVYGKSKKGKPFYRPEDFYALKDISNVFNGFGDFLNVMINKGFKEWYTRTYSQYRSSIIDEFGLSTMVGFSIFGELFNSSQMNTLVYDIKNGAYVVFGIKLNDGSGKGVDISTSQIAIDIMKDFVKRFNGVEGWKIYYKNSVKIDIGKQFAEELSQFIKNNIEAIKTRKRSPDILDKKNKAKEELVSLLMKWKKHILTQTEGVKSFLGGNEIEGVVIRNKKTGSIMKVVDVDKF
jgi:hypothetical protein